MVELISPNKTSDDNDWMGWAYCAGTLDKEWSLIYFEKGCKQGQLSDLLPEKDYMAVWFNPRDGSWLEDSSVQIKSDASGSVKLPGFPGGYQQSETDWALKVLQ